MKEWPEVYIIPMKSPTTAKAQKRLGHSSYAVTMDTYSYVLEEVDKEANDTIEVNIFKKIRRDK